MTLDIQNALSKRNYQDAAKSVVAMCNFTKFDGITSEQHIILKNTIQNVKLRLAEAASEGDTNAMAAIHYFKMNSAAGR